LESLEEVALAKKGLQKAIKKLQSVQPISTDIKSKHLPDICLKHQPVQHTLTGNITMGKLLKIWQNLFMHCKACLKSL
jgi:hypothetical protein